MPNSPPSNPDVIFDNPSDPYSPFRGVWNTVPSLIDGCKTLTEIFDRAVSKFTTRKTLGVRKIRRKVIISGPNGRPVVKKDMESVYTFSTYQDTGIKVNNLAKGLLSLGVEEQENVTIFMDTRVDFFLLEQAVWKCRGILATLYASLGEEGIVHGLNELESSILLTSNDLLPKIARIRGQLKHLKKVIVARDSIGGRYEDLSVDSIPGIELVTVQDLETMGSNVSNDLLRQRQSALQPSDTAIIMYTSGSTGIPKGVIKPHSNVVSAVLGVLACVSQSGNPDSQVYVAYLPMAHIFEMIITQSTFATGIEFGFGSPFTFLRGSPGLAEGTVSDAEVMRPTFIIAVPLMLDRIRKTIEEQVSQKGKMTSLIFNGVLRYRSFMSGIGVQTSIVDRIFLSKVRAVLGGRVGLCIAGGAPLVAQTQSYIENVMGFPVAQVYSTTEAIAVGTGCKVKDRTLGLIGIPFHGCRIKLIDWSEGGYRVTDKPNPRGEVVLGGWVSPGYFKRPELTEESFYTDEHGIRWFISGDIGELFPNGYIKIIDRRKDLIKLPLGEYISLGKIEAIFKTCPVVENICIATRPTKNYLVAVVMPNRPYLTSIAKSIGIDIENTTLDSLCRDSRVIKKVTTLLQEAAKANGLSRLEAPTKVLLTSLEWIPDTGLVTAALKIRRKNIYDYYSKQLEALFD